MQNEHNSIETLPASHDESPREAERLSQEQLRQLAAHVHSFDADLFGALLGYEDDQADALDRYLGHAEAAFVAIGEGIEASGEAVHQLADAGQNLCRQARLVSQVRTTARGKAEDDAPGQSGPAVAAVVAGGRTG